MLLCRVLTFTASDAGARSSSTQRRREASDLFADPVGIAFERACQDFEPQHS
jgi:hypothetical protein